MRKRKSYSEEQIIGILKESEAKVSTSELCRKYGMSAASFCRWKAKFGGMDLSDAKRLKALEEENRKLKKLVADQALDLIAAKEILSKKW